MTINWEQVQLGGKPREHYMATVAAPFKSVSFASVNQMLDGQWKVNFTPKGRGLREPITYHGPYLTKEKAMQHVERWAKYHWRSVPAWVPPDSRVGQPLN
ncbi:hypothetical protein [Dyella japonica]|uniref:hypothetical protein n=1 Tax=Dyella japonica TaxID=231455 RepID=UPI00138EE386|nr:hypothetical protein [Dyella japonica]